MNALRILVAMALSLAMLGCSSLLKVSRQPFTIYSPQYSAVADASAPRVDWQLIVDTPLASDALDSSRIAVMPHPGVIEVLPGARWSDTAPALLRRLIIEGFEHSGRIVGVGSAASGMRADFALAIELRDFQLELTAAGAQARIGFQARLLDYSSNRVLASRAFDTHVAASGADAAGAFTAFQAALNEIVPMLVEWTLAEGTSAQAPARPRA